MDVPSTTQISLRHPDDLTFADLWQIKAATGVDLIAGGVTITEQLPVLVWWAWSQDLPETAPSWQAFAGEIRPRDLGDHGEQLQNMEAERLEALERREQERDQQAAVAEQLAAIGDPLPEPAEPEEPETDPTGAPASTSRTRSGSRARGAARRPS